MLAAAVALLAVVEASAGPDGGPDTEAHAEPHDPGASVAAGLVDTALLRSGSLSWWSGDSSGFSDAGDLLDVLLMDAAALRSNPLDLNSASAADLCRVPGIEASDAVAIVRSREADGLFREVGDLIRTGRFDERAVRAVRPYVVCAVPQAASGVDPTGGSSGLRVGRVEAVGRSPLEWSARLKVSWEVDPEDDWSTHEPSDAARAARTYAGLRARAGGGWSAGVGVERDPWERRGVDHVAFHLSKRPETRKDADYLLSFTVGDLIIDWGQGLLAGGGGFGDARRFPRSTDRVRGYDGAGESAARRGVHASVSRGAVGVDLVGAVTSLDAGLDADGLATTIRTSGLHRTSGERAGRGKLKEGLACARVRVGPVGPLAIGASVVLLSYSPGLARGDPERQRFRFHGNRLSGAAVDARLTCDAWSLGVELARAATGGLAAVVSARGRSGSLSARFGAGHLSRDYWVPLGGGVPFASGGSNATSAWVDVEHRTAPWLRWRVECVVRGRPWRSYHDQLPDTGARATVGATLKLKGVGTLDGELRVRTTDPGSPGVERETSTRRRLSLRTAGRVPLVVAATSAGATTDAVELGRATSVEVRFDLPLGDRSLVSAGVAATTSWGRHDPVVYYEPSLPGDFSLHTLNISGSRCYIRVRTGVTEVTSLAARLSCCPARGEYSFGISIDMKG